MGRLYSSLILALLLLSLGCMPEPEPETRIERILRQAEGDPGHGNVRVTLERLEMTSVQGRGLRGRRVQGSWSQNGLQAWVADPAWRASVRTDSSSRVRSQKQFLIVQPGGMGQLSTLSATPRPVRVVIPVYRGAVVVDTIETVVTGSGFRVLVRSADATGIELELLPYFHSREARGGVYIIQELATRVRLAPGETMVLMGDTRQDRAFGHQFLGLGQTSRSETVVLLLTADGGTARGP